MRRSVANSYNFLEENVSTSTNLEVISRRIHASRSEFRPLVAFEQEDEEYGSE